MAQSKDRYKMLFPSFINLQAQARSQCFSAKAVEVLLIIFTCEHFLTLRELGSFGQ
jgi:hypothetical protein